MIERLRAEPGLPRVARAWIAVALLIAWAATLMEIQRGLGALGTASAAVLSSGFVACVAFWARGRPGAVPAGIVAFALLAVLVAIEHMPGERHGKHLPAIVLLVSTIADLARRPDRALDSACGATAGVYVTAGLAKIFLGGRDFVAMGALSMLIVERSVTAPEPLRAVRHLVGTSPMLASSLAVGAVVIELGGVGWLFPRLRVPTAALGIAMHLGIAILLGFFYPEWVCVLIGLGLASRAQVRGLNSSATPFMQ